MSCSLPSVEKPWFKFYPKEDLSHEPIRKNLYEAICHDKEMEERIALEYFGVKVSYGKLHQEIERAAKGFVQSGMRKGDIVSLILPSLPETIYAVYALNRIGAIANMIDIRCTPSQIKESLERTHSKTLIIMAFYLKQIELVREQLDVDRIIVLRECETMPKFVLFFYKLGERMNGRRSIVGRSKKYVFWDKFIKGGRHVDALPEVEGDTKDAAMIFQTSGTTGIPKSVVHSAYNANNAARYFHYTLNDPQVGDRVLCTMPAFAAFGFVTNIHLALMYGMEVHIIPLFDSNKFARILKQHRPNHLFGVPSPWEKLTRELSAKNDLSFVKSIHLAGEILTADLQRRIGQMLQSHGCRYPLGMGYGMTETGGAVTALVPRLHMPKETVTGRVGIPAPYANIRITDYATGEELTYGEVGEICVNTPIAMRGYHMNQEATDQLMRTHKDGLKWIHTGDTGYMDKDGYLFIVGRDKRMIVRHDGTKLFPVDIEGVVSTHPNVMECAVVPIDDPEHPEAKTPCAIMVFRQGADVAKTGKEVMALCKQNLSKHQLPYSIKYAQEIPHTANGKTDYAKVEAMIASGTASAIAL